jgi:hypothetical protein
MSFLAPGVVLVDGLVIVYQDWEGWSPNIARALQLDYRIRRLGIYGEVEDDQNSEGL